MNFMNAPMAPMEESYDDAKGSAQQAGLDAQARKAGYRNYDEMRAFLLRRAMPHDGTVQGAPLASSMHEAQNMVRQNVVPAHPASIFSYIADKLRQVNER